MKSEVRDVGACRKELSVEIPAAAVDAAIDRLAKRYGKSAKLPGFRPGKAPPRIVRARFRERILEDLARDLIPDAVGEALAEHAIEPVDTPRIRDVEVDEGRPLTFTALLETLPPIDPGDYSAFTLRGSPAALEPDAVERALERLRQARGRLDPVTGRGAERGDVLTIDCERRLADRPADAPERLRGVRVEIGADANPPRLDDELLGLEPGAERSFTLRHAADDEAGRLAGREVSYAVVVKTLQRPVFPDLDDDFARSLGKFDGLAGLRARVEADLRIEAEAEARNEVRRDLLRQLAKRMTAEVPEALIAHEVDRRADQVRRSLAADGIDPRQARIDWDAFREAQREAAADAVRGALVLDEIAGREAIEVSGEEVDREFGRQAELSGRAPQAIRALIEKDGGLERLKAGLRRDKAVALLMERATIVSV